MRVLLLGAGGFIGSHLVEAMIAQGEHVVTGVDVTDEKLDGISGPNFKFVKSDVVHDLEAVDEMIDESDVVVDLIGYANPSIYITRPLEVFELNFQFNLHVVERCVDTDIRFIQYSTSEVYGRPTGPTYVEDASEMVMGPVNKQRWIYATSKALLERVIHAYGLEDRLNYTIVRPFNFIGSRLDYLVPAGTKGGPRVFSHFMSALLTGGPMYLVNGGDARRSFTHIEDANEATLTLLSHPDARNQVFNIGNPANDISIRDFAALMCRVYEELTGDVAACRIVDIDGEEFYGPGYQDTTRVPPDISKLRALGWEPRHDLHRALTDAMRHYLDATDQPLLIDGTDPPQVAVAVEN